ncbi:MAG: riboflavin synthase, partial [Candidatus Omnitrophica bacterium]|nr:riboflavin synthase [Candidatus Omnitrophota bacterium]
CVNGICLTVVEIERDLLCLEIMQETFARTNLGLLRREDKVNLEQALRVDGRLDGHFVTGHIDGTGVINRRQRRGPDIVMQIQASEEILRYVVLKGSVALEGVSLTVSALDKDSLSVNLIPYTLKNTTLGLKKEQDVLNIECDILAKYIDRSLLFKGRSSDSNLSSSFLREHGFI